MVASLREFARRELAPKYAQWDRNGQFPREQWLKMGAIGVLGLRIPAEHGGSGHSTA